MSATPNNLSQNNSRPPRCGRIELILGPMFAGKTTELMRRVKREVFAARKCFIIKYAADTRYDACHVSSHDKQLLRACANVSKLSDVGNRWMEYDVIAIDEGQFFPDVLTFCETVAEAGKIVYVAALDGDFQRKPFGKVCDLIPLCERVEKLTAVCMICHSAEAAFSRRTVDCSKQELIGGSEMYLAACRACHQRAENPTPRKVLRIKQNFKEIEHMTGKRELSTTAEEGDEAESAAKRNRCEVSTSPDGHAV